MQLRNSLISFAMLCLAGQAAAQSHWSWRNPLPQGNDLYNAIWTGDQFVAVGEGGVILTSPNGKDWADRSTQNTAHLHGLASHGGVIVAVGDYGQILSSTDGVDWVKRTTEPYSFGYWNRVEWIDSQFVAVGENSDLMTSKNGIDWKYIEFNSSSDFRKIAAIRKTLVIFTDTKTAYVSTAGAGWTLAPTATFPTMGIHGVAKFDTLLVATSDSGIVWLSSDGLNWTRTQTPTKAHLWSVSPAGSKLIVLGDSGVWLSTVDGKNWNRSTIGQTAVGSVRWDGHQYLGLGGNGSIWLSPDSAQWTSVSSGSRTNMNGMAKSNSQMVVVGASGFVATSPDGIRWTTRIGATSNSLNSVAWTGSKFVAVGGEVVSSVDGANWTLDVDLPTSFFAIVWADTQLVAVGYDGKILTSPDGQQWTSRTSGITTQLRSLTWTGKLLVAGGQGGQILTSPDGIVWTKRSTGTTTPIWSLVWTGTKIVSGDDRGIIRTSTDGQTWVATDTITFYPALTWTGKQLVSAGYLGSIYSSVDGTKWTSHSFNAWNDFNCIGQIGNTIVAAGDNGMIASSPEDEISSILPGKPAQSGLLLVSTRDFLRIHPSSPENVQIGHAGIRTLSGRQILTATNIKPDARGEYVLSIGTLPAGPYILEIRQSGRIVSQKFVVSR